VVPVTVYIVVAEGVAVTTAPVVVLRPVAGIHEYVVAPDAVSVEDEPLHIVPAEALALTGGATVTVTDEVLLHEDEPVK
jgi:hypothetical protein